MRPSKKGWVRQHFELLKKHAEKASFIENLKSDYSRLSHEKNLYKLVQPTGLMYGHPLRSPGDFGISISNWNDKEKMKFILLNGFIYDILMVQSGHISSKSDVDDCLHDTLDSILHFYRGVVAASSNISTKEVKKKNEFEQVELMLDKRLEVPVSWMQHFWTRFFQNSLLFLDIYYFDLWIAMNKTFVDVEKFKKQQEELRLQILQVIAVAARSNNVLEKEEEALYKFFLKSSNLGKENQKKAMDFLHSDLALDDIEFDVNKPWLLRKYILELSLLTVWADRNVDEIEMQFVKDLAVKIGFKEQELDDSMLAIESFVITNWENIHFLQKKGSFHIVKEQFSKRIKNVVNNNKKAIIQEIHESKELMQLLMKMTKEKLTDHEKVVMRAQLIDVLKTLPTFVIIALPGTFITLPVLLNVLPRSAFPSAFSEID